jgi:hypothetical protein
MRLLQLPTKQLKVQRSGLPFFDAARVIGVAQLFFGTSNATVTETGFGWVLKGVTDLKELDKHRLWIRDRLRRFERKPNNYARLENWLEENDDATLKRKWEAICTHFTEPLADVKPVKENTTGLMDAALALGARGYDLGGYKDLAAESGTPSQQPEAETLVALLGLSHAARVNNAMFLLPVFGSPEQSDQTFPVTTARYWNYNRYFAHEGGEKIAATWAMLSMLESLFAQGLPVQDFAYNRADRPIYHSGTLGAEKLCLLWRNGCEAILREIGRYLQDTQREKGGHGADLARALTDFALNPNAVGLERIVRLKARAMADEDNRAKSLFRQSETLKEITQMVKTNNGEIPQLPESLVRAVRQALNPTKDNKGWIGGYMKLENANTPHRFIEEAQRLISRAKIDRPIYYTTEESEQPLPELIDDLAVSPQKYRAFRAAFLLRILQIRPATSTTRQTTETLQESNDEEDTTE